MLGSIGCVLMGSLNRALSLGGNHGSAPGIVTILDTLLLLHAVDCDCLWLRLELWWLLLLLVVTRMHFESDCTLFEIANWLEGLLWQIITHL